MPSGINIREGDLVHRSSPEWPLLEEGTSEVTPHGRDPKYFWLSEGQVDAEAILAIEDSDYWNWKLEYFPDKYRTSRMNRRRHAVFVRHFTMFRIYRLAEKMVRNSKGAPVQFFVKKILKCRDKQGKRIGKERTIRSYLRTVMKALSRDYHVQYTSGKGYTISCYYWQAMKAKHGKAWDPVGSKSAERAARSYWLTKEAKIKLARALAAREAAKKGTQRGGGGVQEVAPHTPIRSNDRVDGLYKRPRGRPKGREPAPKPIRKVARRVLEEHPLPHCPRLQQPEQLAFDAAIRLLCRGYWRNDVGRTIRKALRITDTAASDGLPENTGRYFWGVLADLVKRLKKPSPIEILLERKRFWEEQLRIAENLRQESLKSGGLLFEVNPRILERLASVNAKLSRLDTRPPRFA